ncbi:MAG: transcriptional repressor [Deltaproteobacteria bacterium]|nr:transcriptional repressor [Deltaproteobacteria bacterium]
MIEKYKDSGLKLTPQRIAILKYLEGNIEHPSADDIYKAMSKRFPTMSFATVYNTLETLRKHGQITELNFDPFKKRFDPNPNPHHHVICVKCQKILDVQNEFVFKPPKIDSEEFEIIGSHIEFYGICSKCKNKKET